MCIWIKEEKNNEIQIHLNGIHHTQTNTNHICEWLTVERAKCLFYSPSLLVFFFFNFIFFNSYESQAYERYTIIEITQKCQSIVRQYSDRAFFDCCSSHLLLFFPFLFKIVPSFSGICYEKNKNISFKIIMIYCYSWSLHLMWSVYVCVCLKVSRFTKYL